MKVARGDPFPETALPDQDGHDVTVPVAGRPTVLFFYPADETPGCIKEACTFRDRFADFQDMDAVVLGISSDDMESHRRFRQKHDLPFPLLVDEGGALRRRLGVPKTLGIVDGRVTFVMDGDRIIRHIFNSQLRASAHVDEARDALQDLLVGA